MTEPRNPVPTILDTIHMEEIDDEDAVAYIVRYDHPRIDSYYHVQMKLVDGSSWTKSKFKTVDEAVKFFQDKYEDWVEAWNF